MLGKLTDVLREVFWLKKKGAKKKPAARKTAAKKKPAKKPVKAHAKPAKAPKTAKKPALDPNLTKAGEITHYFDRIKVAVVKITSGTILVGDRLTVAGKAKPFVQKVWSMQIESKDVKVAKKGQLIGIKIDKPAAPGDIVYK